MEQRETVVNYMVEELHGERHEALDAGPGSGVGFNQIKGVFEPGKGLRLPTHEKLEELYVEYYDAEKKFDEAAAKYQRKLQKYHGISVTATSPTWNDCESAMLSACQVMEGAAKKDREEDIQGFVGKLRNTMRSFCNHAKDAKSFLALIPSEPSCTSILSGGLKVIFEAAERVGYHRKTVYEHLEQLPNILSKKSRFLEVYADLERLHKLMSILCATVFEHFAYILEWFTKNAGKSAFKALWRPQTYCDKLADNMAQIKLREKDFDDEVSILDTSEQRQHRMRMDFALEHMVRADALNSVLEDLQNKLAKRWPQEHVHADLKIIREVPEDISQHNINESMLKKFQYDPSLAPEDYQTVTRMAADLGKKDETRLAHLVQNIRVQAWLTVDESSLLFISGNGRHRTKSPVSVFCGKLVAAAMNNVNMIVTSFFCGRHTDSLSDVNARPTELAMSILLQLVDQYRDFEASTIYQCMDKLDPGDAKSICKATGRLVKELPSTKIWFCVIDAIGFYYDRERRQDMYTILEYLVRAVRNAESQRIKFVVSTPGRWIEIEDYFEMDEVLLMPTVCASGGKLTESKWMDNLGDEIADLSP